MALFGRETARDQERVASYREWFLRQHPFALASAVLSIFSLTHFGTLFVDELAGIVLGVLAIRSVAREGRGHARLAYLGIAVGTISLIAAIILYTRKPA
jgi:hypothetical protein